LAKNKNKKNEKVDNEKGFSKMSIVWYPGHMAKAKNDIKNEMKLIDIVIEVLDARIPISSTNLDFEEIFINKPRIIVLNKSDIADNEETLKWKKYFEENGIKTVVINKENQKNIKELLDLVEQIGKMIYNKKNSSKIVEIRPIYRVAIVGIPNVGKSTLINKLAKRDSAKVGNKPGVTVTNKWIRIANNIDLLDTPGILMPKLDKNFAGEKLALTGNIKLEIIDVEELACFGIGIIKKDLKYREMLIEKYLLKRIDLEKENYEILELIGKKNGCLISGGNIDTVRASKLFLEDIKNGRIGSITFERC